MMTTPERFRRRQRIEGAILVVLGLFMAISTFWFDTQDRAINQCINRNFLALSASMEVRAHLTNQETAAEQRIWRVYAQAAGLVKDPKNPKLSKADQQRLNIALVAALLNYQSTIERIQQERRLHPVPPYPIGDCRARSS